MGCCGFTVPGMAGCACGGSCGCRGRSQRPAIAYSGNGWPIPAYSSPRTPSSRPRSAVIPGGTRGGGRGLASSGATIPGRSSEHTGYRRAWSGPAGGGGTKGCWREPVGGGGGLIAGGQLVSKACGGEPTILDGALRVPGMPSPPDPLIPPAGGGGGGVTGGRAVTGGGGFARHVRPAMQFRLPIAVDTAEGGLRSREARWLGGSALPQSYEHGVPGFSLPADEEAPPPPVPVFDKNCFINALALANAEIIGDPQGNETVLVEALLDCAINEKHLPDPRFDGVAPENEAAILRVQREARWPVWKKRGDYHKWRSRSRSGPG